MTTFSDAASVAAPDASRHSLVASAFPAFLPYHKELYMSDVEFNAWINSLPDKTTETAETSNTSDVHAKSEGHKGKKRGLDCGPPLTVEDGVEAPRKSLFMDALARGMARDADANILAAHNRTLTENGDVAYLTTKSALVDAFYELEENTQGARVQQLLDAAWRSDPLATLKILFNGRSIHLGKSSRNLAYQAFGWLYQEHPKTLLTNLVWLVRPVIEKKVEKDDEAKGAHKASDDDEDYDMISDRPHGTQETAPDVVLASEGLDAHDVRHGLAHGYWKDLLNLLNLAASNELRPYANRVPPQSLQKTRVNKRRRNWDHKAAVRRKAHKITTQHERVVELLQDDPTYRALHFTIARLFAAQLKQDCERLSEKQEAKKITYAGKWAPSPKEAHDKNTFIVSTIAELLHSHDAVCPGVAKSNREMYLRHAREAYRRLTISPLRKHLGIVERDITAKTFENIDYQRLPSLAMRHHQSTFILRDFERFQAYTTKVAEGKARTSGATLLPSTLIYEVLTGSGHRGAARGLQQAAKANLADGQWKTLVQRIRDSGAMKSSVAICDVSGSMNSPRFADGTRPIDSAIGLSLLLAEVCEPPFGGGFITFSESPSFQKVGGVGDKRTLHDKVIEMARSHWGMNTDFVAVFEKLILPRAIEYSVAPEDMVKQVFVFSDMQFDSAAGVSHGYYASRHSGRESWNVSSFERIKSLYAKAGYEMPQLIFWNLAGGRSKGKPVTQDDTGTALVSGYSQGQMKMFLDGGNFEKPEEEEVVEETEVEAGDGETLTDVKVRKEKPKMTPLAMVRKAISHPAYAMLKVVD